NPSVICDITWQGAYCGAGICCESTSTGVTQRHKVYKRIANFTLNLKELHDGRYRQPVGAPNDGARLDRRACDFRNCSLVHTVRHGYEQEISLVPDRWAARTKGALEKRTRMGTASKTPEVAARRTGFAPSAYYIFEYRKLLLLTALFLLKQRLDAESMFDRS